MIKIIPSIILYRTIDLPSRLYLLGTNKRRIFCNIVALLSIDLIWSIVNSGGSLLAHPSRMFIDVIAYISHYSVQTILSSKELNFDNGIILTISTKL